MYSSKLATIAICYVDITTMTPIYVCGSPRWKVNINPLRISIVSLRSKCCIYELLLRVGLIYIALCRSLTY